MLSFLKFNSKVNIKTFLLAMGALYLNAVTQRTKVKFAGCSLDHLEDILETFLMLHPLNQLDSSLGPKHKVEIRIVGKVMKLHLLLLHQLIKAR